MPIYFNPASADAPLTIDSIGNHWKQERIERPNGFPQYHWLQTERGAGEIALCGKKLMLPEGQGLMIAPFTPHAYRAVEGEWITSFVTFTGRLATDIGKIVGGEPYTLLRQGEGRALQAWTDEVVARCEVQSLDPMQLSVDCYRFLLDIRRACEGQKDFSNPLYQRYVAPAVRFIETEYAEDIDIGRLAGAVYVTPQYLMRLFQRFLGSTPRRYLIHTRLNKAKELLVNRPGMEIQEIGERVGYHDTSHFISAFKEATGHTPRSFRRLHRQ